MYKNCFAFNEFQNIFLVMVNMNNGTKKVVNMKIS